MKLTTERLEQLQAQIDDEGVCDTGIVQELLEHIYAVNDELLQSHKDFIRLDRANMSKASRIVSARKALGEMIDGGDECRGRDAEISRIMDLLEGTDA